MAGPPVLAVRPFMGERRHLWCGEMSLPGYYERCGRTEVGRRHSFPTDLIATGYATAAAAGLRGDSSDSLGGGQAATETSLPPAMAASAAVFVPQPPRWTSFRGNSWQQELDAVRYLFDIDDGRLEAGAAAGSRRPGSVVSCRTECVSPDGPLKALPRYGFSPTIHDREVKTRAESDANRASSLTAKTVKPFAGAGGRCREPRRHRQQQQRRQQQQGIVTPPTHLPIADRSRRSQTTATAAAMHRPHAADGTVADGVDGNTATIAEPSLEEFYRQLLSGGDGHGAARDGGDEALPYDDDSPAAVAPAAAPVSMPTGASAAACPSAIGGTGAADASASTATIVINSSSVDDTYAHSAGATDARAAFRLLRSHAGPRTAVEQTLERDFALLVRRELDDRRTPRASNGGAQAARLLRPANGAQTHGELFIRLSRDLNGGAMASHQAPHRGQWPPPPTHVGAPWQRRAATYADGFGAFGAQPEYGARGLSTREDGGATAAATAASFERRRQSSTLLAVGSTAAIAFPSIVG